MKTISQIIQEAAKKKPSDLKKLKDKSYTKDVTFCLGDIYDFSGNDEYTEKVKYYSGEGDGYITDKEGHYYDVIANEYTGDTGRICGGTMHWELTIKKVNGKDDARFYGYHGAFSNPSSKTCWSIIEDIRLGMYLEDYIAKHWNDLKYYSEKFEELKKKGNPEAKTYTQEKEDSKQDKLFKFYTNYIIFADFFTVGVNEKGEMYNWSHPKLPDSDNKKKDNYVEAFKKLQNVLNDIFNKVIGDKICPLFHVSNISDLQGLEFNVKIYNGSDTNVVPAIDIKNKKLVLLSGFYSDKPKVISDKFDISVSQIKVDHSHCSDTVNRIIQKAHKIFLKTTARTKTKYVNDCWKKIYDGSKKYSWGNPTITQAQAKEQAKKNFEKLLREKDITSNRYTFWNWNMLKDCLDDKLPEAKPGEETTPEGFEKPKEETKPKTESKPTSKALKEAEPKMTAWHQGKRKQNVKACSDAKLKLYYKTCKELGYDKEASLLKTEADARGLVLESSRMKSLKDYIKG